MKLKFKAWIISQKKVIDVFGFNKHLVFEQISEPPHIRENIYEIEDCILLQFTGKQDKKGNDIHRGDIVEIKLENYTPLKTTVLRYLIVYNQDGFQGCNLFKKHRINFLNQEILHNPKRFNYKEWDKMEKIGNMHQNPELLNF